MSDVATVTVAVSVTVETWNKILALNGYMNGSLNNTVDSCLRRGFEDTLAKGPQPLRDGVAKIRSEGFGAGWAG